MISLKIELTPESKRVLQNLRNARPLARRNMYKVFRRMLRIMNNTARRNVMGPRPSKLDRVSGKLYQSIGHSVDNWKGDTLEGLIGVGAGSKPDPGYAAIHEFGYNKMQMVKGHTRTQTQIFGVPVTPFTVQVKPYPRMMRMPKRSYVTPAVDEHIPSLRHRLAQAVVAAVGGKVEH